MSFPIDRDSDAHGIALWFDAELAPGVTLSNRPETPELVYGCSFFPWPEPIELHAGDLVELHLTATPGEGDYSWRWQTRITARKGTRDAEFDQSTSRGMLIPAKRLSTANAGSVP